MTLLPADTRSRFARSTAALMAMPELVAAVEAEVEATFAEQPMLPRTAQARCILWGLALPQLSQTARAANSTQKTQTKKA